MDSRIRTSGLNNNPVIFNSYENTHFDIKWETYWNDYKYSFLATDTVLQLNYYDSSDNKWKKKWGLFTTPSPIYHYDNNHTILFKWDTIDDSIKSGLYVIVDNNEFGPIITN